MKQLLLILGVMFTCLLHAGDNASWTSLFNGHDLTGWTIECKPEDRSHAFWTVENGAIVANSMNVEKHDYIWLVSAKEYADFVLKLRFQAFKDCPGNSGLQVRSRYDATAFWLDGPQLDINPPGPWRTGMIWDETRGMQCWLYPDVPKGKWVDPSMAKPGLKFHFSGDEPSWNDMEVTVRGTSIKATLNGVLITDYEGAGVLNDSTHQQHKVGMKGHIALQIHTGDKLHIKYKDLFIKELH